MKIKVIHKNTTVYTGVVSTLAALPRLGEMILIDHLEWEVVKIVWDLKSESVDFTVG